MAFPSDVLGTVVQIKINGVWTDVVRYDDNTKILQKVGVSIKRGASGLQDRTPPGICSWTWTDPNGIYNNENPRSPYYGLLPRNTPVRVYVPRAAPSLYIIDRDDGSRAQTTDKAQLDITGDLEIRFDIEPRRWDRWSSGQNRGMIVASKYNDTTERSWYVRFGEPGVDGSLGPLALVWSTNGTNSRLASCTAKLPSTGRIAVKITLDVDDGGGQNVVRFYTSTTGIDGTFTQLGATMVGAVTSVFAGSANLELGTMNGGMLQKGSALWNFIGRIHAFRLYNGIGGTLVADADFAAQAVGTTSFADGLGNTWTIEDQAEITDADYRFHGELSSLAMKPKQSNDGEGVEINVEAEAGGLLRRIGSNETPLQSPIFMTFSNYGTNGWWPGEESASSDDSTSASSGTSTGNAAVISDITFEGFDSEIPGSAGVMKLGAAGYFQGVANNVPSTGESHFYIFFKFPSVPVADQEFVTWYNTGTVKKYTLRVGTTSYHLRGYDALGTLVIDNNVAFGTGGEPNRWIAYHSRQIQNGANTDVTHEWHAVGTDSYFNGGIDSAAGTNGRPDRVVINPGSGSADVKFCHVMMSPVVGLEFFSGTATANVVNFARAFSGESADSRFNRVCALIGVESQTIGYPALVSQLMGPQPIDTAIEILYECAETDGGRIIEANDRLALEFRPIRSLYNQYGMTLTWAQLAEGLEMMPDDTGVANDIILTRAAGGTARATLEYGPMSIQSSPNGINPVPDGPTVNCYTTAQLALLVQAMLVRRTWPTSRYPTLRITMHHPTFSDNAALFLEAAKTEISDIIRVTDLPLFMAPAELALMASGITEELKSQEWEITWPLTPYGPYETGETQTVTGDRYSNLLATHDTIDGVVQSQLNADINNSTTSIAVKTLSGPVFVTGAVDIDIQIDGEFMNVSNVAGATSPQTLTVTRGTIGGYAASHSANAYVYVLPAVTARL